MTKKLDKKHSRSPIHSENEFPVSLIGVSSFHARVALTAVVALLLSACAGNPYQPEADAMAAVKARAESQTVGDVRVSVAVPSPEETQAIFDLPLYDRKVQPVWIEVGNGGASDLRYAPVGTDPEYVPPFEVAYTHKAGFSKAAHQEMERYLHGLVMARTIDAGEVRAGFVFTQARPGTKGVNVDLYGPEADDAYSFVFFVPVPGFVADHAQVNFEELYAAAELATYDLAGLYKALGSLPCCSTDASGDLEGDPLNLVMVGEGDALLQALLRAGWFERLALERGSGSMTEAAYLFGRPADAVFRTARPSTGARSELRLWMAPMQVGEQPVWLGDVIHFISGLEGPIGLDPDLDDARDYFLQDLWYAQGLAKFAWLKGPNVVSIDQPKKDVKGNEYFTDGYRAVIWPSGTPVSLLQADYLAWDNPPQR